MWEPLLVRYARACLVDESVELRSGARADRYVDGYQVLGTDDVQHLAVKLSLLMPVGIDLLAGVVLEGALLAQELRRYGEYAVVYCRPRPKRHGRRRQVEGRYGRGQRACLVEGTVTTGGAVIAAARALRRAGLVVEDVVAVMDREQGARGALAAEGLRLRALWTLGQLVEVTDV